MSTLHLVRRFGTAAVVAAATSTVIAGPAAAAVLPQPWQVRLGTATASGTQTVRQDPLGTRQTRTVKGVIGTGGAAGCFHVRITFRNQVWDSPATCGSEPASPFVTSYETFIQASIEDTIRLCAGVSGGAQCGAPVILR